MTRSKLLTITAAAALAAGVGLAGTAKAGPASKNLLAGQFTDVGSVDITHNGDVTVDVTTDSGWILLEVHIDVQDEFSGFPTTGSGNPKVGHFEFSQKFESEDDVTVAGFTTPNPDTDGDLYVAVHAEVLDTTSGATLTVVSDFDTQVTDTNTANATPFDAVELTFIHPAWSSNTAVDGLADDGAAFIWETDGVVNPEVDESVSFSRTFNLGGLPLSGSTLDITCDNEDAPSVNSTSFPVSSDWPIVNTHDISSALSSGTNVLEIDAKNFGLAGKTEDENPAMCIYILNASYSNVEESAWGQGTDFDGKNWATFIFHDTRL